MKRALISIVTVLGLLGSGLTSFANSPETVRQSITAGDFAGAFTQAEALETADGYALAAESLLSEIMLGLAEKNKKQAKRARKLAEAALEIDPGHQNARLQYVAADGFVGRETGDVSAWMNKLPQKTEAAINAYRADFPNDARGDALLGAWHLTVARKAGIGRAKKWFGANVEDGRKYCQSALAAQPGDVVIAVNYTFSLLALEDEDFSDIEAARQILVAVSTLKPADHLGQVLKDYAAEALGEIEDRERVRRYTEMFLEGKVPEFPAEN